jgi:1A family penicillin-binding protein
MAGTGKKSPPLVAERRYPKKPTNSKSTATPKKARRKTAVRRKKAPAKRGLLSRIFRWFLRLIWWFTWRIGIASAAVVAAVAGYFALGMPPTADLLDARARGSVTMLDRGGAVFAWRGEQFGGMTSAVDVSPHLKNAVIATEDKRFYRHFGVSPRGIASAVRINLSEGRGPLSGHGGSTITQQTAKLLCVGNPYDPTSGQSEAQYEADCRASSLKRKAVEALYALGMEMRYTKDEILTIYLNRVYAGAGTRGFEAASQRYFGKSATEVSPAEAAMLAGLLTAPSRYAPTANLKRSQDRAAVILRLMEDQGFITAAEAEFARANPAQLSEAAQEDAGGYFADWVMDQGPSFLTRDTTEDVVIQTTFDASIQEAAEEAVATVFDELVKEGSEAQAAVVVMSADGAVRGMVGGRKFRGVEGYFNRAIQAKRQTGSAFKPFVFATALDLGYRYDDTILDGPITIDVPGSGPWSPENYSREYRGPVTMTDALKFSLNTPAVRISEDVGRDLVRTVANQFGIDDELAEGPALALGVSETTLLRMTGAYAGILNGGSSVTPYGLVELRLQGEQDPLMDQSGGIGERVITPAASEQLIYMMNQVVVGGTGQRATLVGREAAAKTGTTQAARDAWFIGFTADYVTGVWMGYDDNKPLEGVTGSGLPAEIWRRVMEAIHTDLPPRPLPMIRPAFPPVAAAFPTRGPDAVPIEMQNAAPSNDGGIIGLLRSILGG